MTEFDPTQEEAAYREASLSDDVGREQRRVRLMAALPRPAPGAVPVARSELAWRWQPFAWTLLGAGLLLATVLALRGRSAEPGQRIDEHVAAVPSAATASAPVLVAQAEPPVAPTAEARPTATRPLRTPPREKRPPAVAVADASTSPLRRDTEAAVSVATESAKAAMEPPQAAAPAEAVPPPVADASAAMAPAESVAGVVSGRARSLLAAPAASPAPASSVLLAAIRRADLQAARAALQAGASVHQRDAQGRTALMLAAGTGSREMVELLLASGARKADRDPLGATAADHALAQGHGELADALR